MPSGGVVNAAAITALVGLIGELVLLRHRLVDTYPFKLFTYPPGEFYEALGNFGSLGILVVTTVLAWALRHRIPLLLPPLLTTVTPLLFLALLIGLTATLYGWTVPADTRNFDGYAVGAATREFADTALPLAAAGLVIGGLCTAILASRTR
jgi:hypothetical protein